MLKLSMLLTYLVAAFAFAAGPAQARKSQWVEYSHGDTKLKAWTANHRQGQRQAPRRAGGRCARGHDAEDAGRSPSCGRSSATVSFAADIFTAEGGAAEG